MAFLGNLMKYKKIINKIKTKVKTKYRETLFMQPKMNSTLNISIQDNEYIKCNWSLNTKDQAKVNDKKIFCLGIRIYDITNSNPHKKSTCIMKEIEINKKSNNYSVPLLINDGQLLVELGYRSKRDKWIELESEILRLSDRSNNNNFIDDSWFYLSKSSHILPNSLHQRMYKLAHSTNKGGSERIQEKI